MLCSTPRLRTEEIPRLRELLYGKPDWNRVLGILATHRTMGTAWYNMLTHLIEERAKLPSTYLFKIPEVTFKGQRIMAREQIDLSLELMAALEAAGVASAMLKGGAVARMAYPSLGMRVFNDNDILVDHRALPEAGAVLRRLGYEQGSWDYRKSVIRPATRASIMSYPVSSHQTHPYMRPTPDALTLECHRVDLHFSVDLMTSNRTDAIVDDLLDRRIAVGDPPLWTLDPVDMTVFGCIHFYKEAAACNEVRRNKDLVLYKLVDLLALLDNTEYPVDPDVLVARAAAMGVTDQVYHALYHLDQLFPGRVPDGLLDRLRPADDTYLDVVIDDDGTRYRWTVPILTRFFDARRHAALVAEPRAAVPS